MKKPFSQTVSECVTIVWQRCEAKFECLPIWRCRKKSSRHTLLHKHRHQKLTLLNLEKIICGNFCLESSHKILISHSVAKTDIAQPKIAFDNLYCEESFFAPYARYCTSKIKHIKILWNWNYQKKIKQMNVAEEIKWNFPPHQMEWCTRVCYQKTFSIISF